MMEREYQRDMRIIQPKKAFVTLLYIMIYMCALSYIRWSYVHTSISEKIYIAMQLSIVLICLLYILMYVRVVVIRFFPILLICFLLYELAISIIRGLFVMPNILIDVLPWPLVLIVFHHYSRNEQFPLVFKQITIAGLIMICFASLPNIFKRESSGSGIFGTYYCLAILPMVYLFVENKKVCTVFSVIVSVLMLFTVKRSAFIVTILGIGFYYLLTIRQEEKNLKRAKKMIGFILLAMVIALLGIYIVNRLDLGIIDRILHIYDDGGSGRTRIWEVVLNAYNKSTQREKVFGHGFHAVFYYVPTFGIKRYAHNSYLETLYDYGQIGLTMIIMIVITLILSFMKLGHEKDRVSPVMGYTIVIMLVLSMVSYFFEQSVMITPLCVVWGICTSKVNIKRGA